MTTLALSFKNEGGGGGGRGLNFGCVARRDERLERRTSLELVRVTRHPWIRSLSIRIVARGGRLIWQVETNWRRTHAVGQFRCGFADV